MTAPSSRDTHVIALTVVLSGAVWIYALAVISAFLVA
jgi:hypothetical protein